MQSVEARLGQIAARQDDVVTRAQLAEVGLTRGAIDARIAAGWLQRRHRGVYFVGFAPPGPAARVRAAVLACGDGAVASHRAAAARWNLLPLSGTIDVSVSGRNPGIKPGIRIHRVAHLHPAELRTPEGLRLTSPARTVCDLPATEPRSEVERALEEAFVRRLITEREVEAVLERCGNRPGSAVIRAILGFQAGPGFSRSKAERALLKLVIAAHLPKPEKNVRVGGHVVDFFWRPERVVVEVDSYGFHGHRAAFERDRTTDQALRAAGYTVIRITWRALREEPFGVVSDLTRALTRAA
jgi:very-short-patch-repair endonuclease